jgi:hypothetical protein
MNDFTVSVCTGLLTGVALITYLHFHPGDPKDYLFNEEKPSELISSPELSTLDNIQNNQKGVEAVGNAVLKRKEKIQKILGVTSDQIDAAINEAKEGKTCRNARYEENIGWIKV